MSEASRYGAFPSFSRGVDAERSHRWVPKRGPRGLVSTGPHPSPPNAPVTGRIPKRSTPDPYAALTLSPLSLTVISDNHPVSQKSANRNSWFRSITSSFMSGGGSPRSETAPPSLLDAPPHVRRRTRSLVDFKIFMSQTVDVESDPRLPAHMRRPELQLRRIQRRDLPSSKSPSSRSSSVDRTLKYPLWWPA